MSECSKCGTSLHAAFVPNTGRTDGSITHRDQRALNSGHSAITRLTPTQTGLQRPGQFCLFIYLSVCSVINLIKYLFQNRSSFRQLSYSRVASV